MRKRHKLPFSKIEFLPAPLVKFLFSVCFCCCFFFKKKQNKTKGRYIIFQPEASQTLLGRERPLQYTLAPLRARHLEFESTSPLPTHHTASQLLPTTAEHTSGTTDAGSKGQQSLGLCELPCSSRAETSHLFWTEMQRGSHKLTPESTSIPSPRVTSGHGLIPSLGASEHTSL